MKAHDGSPTHSWLTATALKHFMPPLKSCNCFARQPLWWGRDGLIFSLYFVSSAIVSSLHLMPTTSPDSAPSVAGSHLISLRAVTCSPHAPHSVFGPSAMDGQQRRLPPLTKCTRLSPLNIRKARTPVGHNVIRSTIEFVRGLLRSTLELLRADAKASVVPQAACRTDLNRVYLLPLLTHGWVI